MAYGRSKEIVKNQNKKLVNEWAKINKKIELQQIETLSNILKDSYGGKFIIKPTEDEYASHDADVFDYQGNLINRVELEVGSGPKNKKNWTGKNKIPMPNTGWTQGVNLIERKLKSETNKELVEEGGLWDVFIKTNVDIKSFFLIDYPLFRYLEKNKYTIVNRNELDINGENANTNKEAHSINHNLLNNLYARNYFFADKWHLIANKLVTKSNFSELCAKYFINESNRAVKWKRKNYATK